MNGAFFDDSDDDEERDDAYSRDESRPVARDLDALHERAMAARERETDADADTDSNSSPDPIIEVEDGPEIGDGRDEVDEPESAPANYPDYRASTEVNAAGYTVVVIQDLADRERWFESTIAYDLGRWC